MLIFKYIYIETKSFLINYFYLMTKYSKFAI